MKEGACNTERNKMSCIIRPFKTLKQKCDPQLRQLAIEYCKENKHDNNNNVNNNNNNNNTTIYYQ